MTQDVARARCVAFQFVNTLRCACVVLRSKRKDRINFYLALRSLRATQRSVLRHIVNPPPFALILLQNCTKFNSVFLGRTLKWCMNTLRALIITGIKFSDFSEKHQNR